MIRDITIGQYYPAQSPIHRLDPRVKIVCTLIFLVSLFVQNSVLGYALAFVFLAPVHGFGSVDEAASPVHRSVRSESL